MHFPGRVKSSIKKTVALFVAVVLSVLSLPVANTVQATANAYPGSHYYNHVEDVISYWERNVAELGDEVFYVSYEMDDPSEASAFYNYYTAKRGEMMTRNYYNLNEFNVYRSGYSPRVGYSTEFVNGEIIYTAYTKITRSTSSYGTSAETNAARAQAASIASSWSGMDPYNQVLAIAEYLCENADYDWDTYYYGLSRGHSLSNCINDHLCVCDGYAQGFQAMAESLGLESYIVTGNLLGGGHAWNAVKLYGNWYFVDVTNIDQDWGMYYELLLFGAGTASEEGFDYTTDLPISSTDYDPYALITFDNDSFTWDPSTGTLTIDKSKTDGNVTIPSTVEGTPIRRLEVQSSGLTNLDVSACFYLEYLNCSDNNLTHVDVSGCPYLQEFICNGNSLTINTSGTMNLSSRPGFDVDCVSALTGGSIEGTTLTFNGREASYTYNCSGDSRFTATFTITCINYLEMFRLYNEYSGEHFYTSNASERNYLINQGWTYEGIAWNAPLTGDPVYRVYNQYAGDHHYTTNYQEVQFLVGQGWTYEGIGWYSADNTGSPLYRLYNRNCTGAGSHHYTMNSDERDYLISIGWIYEGIGWYGK